MSSKEFVWSPRHPRRSGTRATRSTAWTRCPVPRNSPTASRCSPRTCCAPRTAPTSPRSTSRRSRTGIRMADPSVEIQFTPARVIMQDFTGVPCIVDLATMREAVGDLGGDPEKVNPLAPADLVIDHSVIADLFGTANAFERNVEIEYERNGERYQFLRWGQGAFDDFKVVPPGTGIVHQVNIEYLASVVMERDGVGVSGHLRRHRLAHHDGERPRRAGLGRRRHRGRGGHARPAGVDADSPCRRLQAVRRASSPASPPPTSCSPSPRCCASTAWSASSSSSTARAWPRCRWPTARRWAT